MAHRIYIYSYRLFEESGNVDPLPLRKRLDCRPPWLLRTRQLFSPVTSNKPLFTLFYIKHDMHTAFWTKLSHTQCIRAFIDPTTLSLSMLRRARHTATQLRLAPSEDDYLSS